MDLQEVSKLILIQVEHNRGCGKDDKSTIEEIEGIIKRRVVDILEPEGVYEKGKYYDGLGRYIGIIDTYPWGVDYFRREHHFAYETPGEKNLSKVAEINKILIREIKK